MSDVITQASNIANVIVAVANIFLVMFVFWQISLQKRFFLEQARRDASQKICEFYQRLSATFMEDKDLAALFYQTHSPENARRRAVWGFVLDTLHHEYRFARQGLHPLQNVRQTAQGYVDFITHKEVLAEIGSILKNGYDADFSNFIGDLVTKRLSELG